MSSLPPVLEYLIHDVLVDEDGLTTKRMFGGYGIYYHGKMFAGIMLDELHIKATTPELKEEFESVGAKQFTYTFKNTGKTTTMPYWRLPDEILEDREALKGWCEKSWNH